MGLRNHAITLSFLVLQEQGEHVVPLVHRDAPDHAHLLQLLLFGRIEDALPPGLALRVEPRPEFLAVFRVALPDAAVAGALLVLFKEREHRVPLGRRHVPNDANSLQVLALLVGETPGLFSGSLVVHPDAEVLAVLLVVLGDQAVALPLLVANEELVHFVPLGIKFPLHSELGESLFAARVEGSLALAVTLRLQPNAQVDCDNIVVAFVILYHPGLVVVRYVAVALPLCKVAQVGKHFVPLVGIDVPDYA
mmetsp:Transcript_4808/g.13895  ORF Transcript_4808/g.13895 Transcript_4808/m.13895 type:complete len:250 (-) Transcript_4808:1644-2393(-)